MKKLLSAAVAASVATLNPGTVLADAEIDELKQQVEELRKLYEQRIDDLESKIDKMEAASSQQPESKQAEKEPSAVAGRKVYGNEFNPSIGFILNGRYSSFSEDESEIAGYAIGEEGERSREGLALDETELNFAANVDDYFYGAGTVAIVREDGEDKIELEEAYLQTLPGAGLPDGAGLKAGRAFWTLGYLNEKHVHEDDFADRPLPYRAFLNKAYNDDGIEVSYVLPTDLYAEIGGGIFRGDDFPFGSADGASIDVWSAYGRLGGDIGDNQSWRVGAYALVGETGDDGREANEGDVTFVGDTNIYAADLRYTWAPTGNPRQQELILQGEYFYRDEDGDYEDSDAGTGIVDFDDDDSGWYAQAVYKFLPQWRVGARYSRLNPADTPAGLVGSALDDDGHDPYTVSLMADWTHSEFSRLRLQYNREELTDGVEDDQIVLQYIMALGAHGAHKY